MIGLYIILVWLGISLLLLISMVIVDYKENKALEKEREAWRNGSNKHTY